MKAKVDMENNEVKYSTVSIRDILANNGIRLTKSMGQNFLIDTNIPKKLVRLSGIDEYCGILEVGPGVGALTQELCKTAGHVTAVELDKRLIPVLSDIFKEQTKVSIIQGDILKQDIREMVDKYMPSLDYHVCANLPYNITTPAITAFIKSNIFRSITVMVQKEVALRICAKPGSKEYGAFTVYANYHTKPEILFDVPPECFLPRPKVTSSVVKMIIREKRLLNAKDEKLYFKVVRAAFGQRRKTLINTLFAVFNDTHSKEKITEIVTECGFDVHIRGEKLSTDEFMELCVFFR